MNTHSQSQSTNQVPKVADFLGVSKTENVSDLAAFNEISQSNDSEYDLFTNNSAMVPIMQTTVVATSSDYEYQENGNSNLQSLTLSMGSGSGSEASGSNGDNSIMSITNITVDAAAPRRNLDSFGQRTSIYRGVTRWGGGGRSMLN